MRSRPSFYFRCFLYLGLAAWLLFCTAGCRETSDAVVLTNVFRVTGVSIPNNFSEKPSVQTAGSCSDGTVYAVLSYSKEDGADAYALARFTDSGEIAQITELSFDMTEGRVSLLCAVGDTVYLAARGNAIEDSDTTVQRIFRVSGGDCISVPSLDDRNVFSMATDGENLLLCLPNGICRLELDGTLTMLFDVTNSDDLLAGEEISGIYFFDGSWVLATARYDQDTAYFLRTFDPVTGEIGEKLEGIDNVSLLTGFGSSFYTSESDGIYSWSRNAEGSYERTMVVNYLNSNLDPSYKTIAPFSQDAFFCVGYDGNPYLLTRVPEDELTAIEVVNLGVLSSDADLRGAVISFNQSQTVYHVTIQDYDGNVSALQLAMRGKDGPDVLLLDDSLPFGQWCNEGIFEDLYIWIDKDEEWNRADFLPNVLAALETDGKLYSIFNRFNIETYAAKDSLLAEEANFTMGEFLSYHTAHPEIQMFAPYFGYLDFVKSYVQFNADRFIDLQAGMVSFDTEGFRTALAYMKELPEGEEAPRYRMDEWYTSNQVLLYPETLQQFDGYLITKETTFGGEDFSYVGFPAEGDSNGALLEPIREFAICHSSHHREGAWAFVRSFLTEEAQESGQYGFPVLQKAFERLYEIAHTSKSTEEDVLTREQADKVYSLVTGTTQVKRALTEIEAILTEEISVYYAGARTLEDTVAVIQNRVNVYVSETVPLLLK